MKSRTLSKTMTILLKNEKGTGENKKKKRKMKMNIFRIQKQILDT